jgi:hypothetical protein
MVCAVAGRRRARSRRRDQPRVVGQRRDLDVDRGRMRSREGEGLGARRPVRRKRAARPSREGGEHRPLERRLVRRRAVRHQSARGSGSKPRPRPSAVPAAAGTPGSSPRRAWPAPPPPAATGPCPARPASPSDPSATNGSCPPSRRNTPSRQLTRCALLALLEPGTDRLPIPAGVARDRAHRPAPPPHSHDLHHILPRQQPRRGAAAPRPGSRQPFLEALPPRRIAQLSGFPLGLGVGEAAALGHHRHRRFPSSRCTHELWPAPLPSSGYCRFGTSWTWSWWAPPATGG